MPVNLGADPTRTTTIRKRYMADAKRRARRLSRDIREFLVDYDALGLGNANRQLRINVLPDVEWRQYQFESDANKTRSFRKWLQTRIDQGVLEVDEAGKPWMAEYIDSSYRKGVIRAYTQVHKEDLVEQADFYAGGKQQFLQDAFASPETRQKIEFLYTRSFNNMEGFTAAVSQQTGQILADGIAAGKHPRAMAREMDDSISALTRKRALVIARSETIYAHAEGQLDSFERLGVDKLGVQAEWSTAGDDRVCVQCLPLEGQIMTVKEARGLIPLHPNCRCMWIPYDKDFQVVDKRQEKKRNERRKKAKKRLKELKEEGVSTPTPTRRVRRANRSADAPA